MPAGIQTLYLDNLSSRYPTLHLVMFIFWKCQALPTMLHPCGPGGPVTLSPLMLHIVVRQATLQKQQLFLLLSEVEGLQHNQLHTHLHYTISQLTCPRSYPSISYPTPSYAASKAPHSDLESFLFMLVSPFDFSS